MTLRTIKLVLLTIYSLYAFSPQVQAQTQQINLVGEYISDATNFDGTGFQFEMVKAIFEPLGYHIKTTVLPYKRALKKVESGQADIMIGMLKHKGMPLIFSDTPHEVDKIVAVFLADNNTDWQGIKTLNNKKLVTLYGMAEITKENIPSLNAQINEVSTSTQALKMILHDRADFMIMTESEYALNYLNLPKVKLISKTIGFVQIHVAFKPSKQGEVLKSIWDKHFFSYLKSKEATRMFESWGASKNLKTTLAYLTKTSH